MIGIGCSDHLVNLFGKNFSKSQSSHKEIKQFQELIHRMLKEEAFSLFMVQQNVKNDFKIDRLDEIRYISYQNFSVQIMKHEEIVTSFLANQNPELFKSFREHRNFFYVESIYCETVQKEMMRKAAKITNVMEWKQLFNDYKLKFSDKMFFSKFFINEEVKMLFHNFQSIALELLCKHYERAVENVDASQNYQIIASTTRCVESMFGQWKALQRKRFRVLICSSILKCLSFDSLPVTCSNFEQMTETNISNYRFIARKMLLEFNSVKKYVLQKSIISANNNIAKDTIIRHINWFNEEKEPFTGKFPLKENYINLLSSLASQERVPDSEFSKMTRNQLKEFLDEHYLAE